MRVKKVVTKLAAARVALAEAIRAAGLSGPGLDTPVETGDGPGTVAEGPALAFRASIWALSAALQSIPRGALDDAIAEAMEVCGEAWLRWSTTIPEGLERRQAERAARTVGVEVAHGA